MKNLLLLIPMLGFLILTPTFGHAQAIGDAYIFNAPAQNGLTPSVLNVVLTDTVNVASIHVIVGSIDGGQDLFSYNFTFDQTTGFPAGVGYSRSGFKITCPIGNMVETPAFFTEVTSTSNSGVVSAPLKFVSN